VINADFTDRVIALVRERLPLLDADDLGELRDAVAKLGAMPGPEVKFCVECEWFGSTTSTACGRCGARLRKATP
jgi:hypothetical protein